jgi:hypothetical protein
MNVLVTKTQEALWTGPLRRRRAFIPNGIDMEIYTVNFDQG